MKELWLRFLPRHRRAIILLVLFVSILSIEFRAGDRMNLQVNTVAEGSVRHKASGEERYNDNDHKKAGERQRPTDSSGQDSSMAKKKDFHDTSESSTLRIAFSVMGEASYFSRWFHRLEPNQTDAFSLVFLYGAFDASVSDSNVDRCAISTSFTGCHVQYIPDTTWTQGRNQLAKSVLRIEEEMDRRFDYWIFADDDIELDCSTVSIYTNGSSMSTRSTDAKAELERNCWQHLLLQLSQKTGSRRLESSHGRITQLTVPYRRQVSRDGWSGVSNYDAYLAIFSRPFVPYLLPYATPLAGDSEWISQAILFCITMTCFPSSVGLFPDIFAYNARHRDYPKDRYSAELIGQAVQQNFGDFDIDLNHYCSHEDYRHMQGRIGPFSGFWELEEALPSPMNGSICQPLVDRFQAWQYGETAQP